MNIHAIKWRVVRSLAETQRRASYWPGYVDDLMRIAVDPAADPLTFDADSPEWKAIAERELTAGEGAKPRRSAEGVAACEAACAACPEFKGKTPSGLGVKCELEKCLTCCGTVYRKLLLATGTCRAKRWPAIQLAIVEGPRAGHCSNGV